MFQGDQKLDAEGHDPLHKTGKFSYVFLVLVNPLVKLNTRHINKEFTVVSVEILILFLKPEIKL